MVAMATACTVYRLELEQTAAAAIVVATKTKTCTSISTDLTTTHELRRQMQ